MKKGTSFICYPDPLQQSRRWLSWCCPLFLSLFLFSCSTTQKNYSPTKKYTKAQLQEDHTLLRDILEKKHPSLYWYSSKDSMDMYFNKYHAAIEDSMTEQRFGWMILAPLLDKIHCGHSSFGMSKAYTKWVGNKRLASFPLYLKIWSDTMVVTANLDRKDSILKRGMIITSINGLNCEELKRIMFNYLPEDGYANNVNYSRLSSNFPYYHRNIFGLSKEYVVKYIDSMGLEQIKRVPYFELPKDSSKKKAAATTATRRPVKKIWEQRLAAARSLVIDTLDNTAIITLNTFSSGRLRRFFRQSFRYIHKAGIKNVVLDIRSNGGGKINLSTLLTRYVSRENFKVADTAYAVARSLRPYTRYIKGKTLNDLGLFFFTKKKADGLYHFGHWERRLYRPKRRNHFGGDLYVLINGPTFSASTLFCNAIKGQQGVTLIGEETGGGWYGNNGIMIPDIILPNTHLRVRLPLFRLVQYKHAAKDGSGVLPDIFIGTSYDALIKGYDKKMQVVMEMIKGRKNVGGQ